MPPGDREYGDRADEGFRRRFEADLQVRLDAVYRGRRWLVASGVEQAAAGLAGELRRRFEVEVLAVGARPGAGVSDASIPLISLGLPPGSDVMAGIHQAERALAHPSDEVMAQVDAWDSDGTARVIGEPFTTSPRLLGRPVFGSRRPEWAALEDKLAIEELWTAAGVATSPSAQVPVGEVDRLMEAHRMLAGDLGTVWAGDNRSGWHGGGSGTYWIPDEAAARAAAVDGRLAAFDRVRVMPFVEGIPCSIHGLVVPGAREPAVLRPCEMLVLRDRATPRLVYARSGTFWDPPAADRAAMREACRRVGIELARRVDYRGVFTLDGVLGADGFVPTEVNLRLGAALPARIPTQEGDEIGLYLVDRAIVEGMLDGVAPADLERWLLPILDAERQVRPLVLTDAAPDRRRRGVVLQVSDGAPVLVEREGDSDAVATVGVVGDSGAIELEWGPGVSGGVLRFEQVRGLPVGLSTAPAVVGWLQAVARAWPVGLPDLEAARSVR